MVVTERFLEMVETVDLEEVAVMDLLEQEVLQIHHHNQDKEDLVVVMVVMVLFTWEVVEVDSAKQETLDKQVLIQDKVDLVPLVAMVEIIIEVEAVDLVTLTDP